MPIYHLEAKVVSRSAGHSAVAKAAYIAREALRDERLNCQHDYRRKGGLLFSDIFLPRHTSDWARDRAELWNRAETAERRKDATIAREYVIALPYELTIEQQRDLLHDFVKECFTDPGYAADVNIHAPNPEGDHRNIHVHILVTDRRLEPDGFAAHKHERQGTHKQRTVALEAIRESWERHANQHLKRYSHEVCIDRRSLAAQGIDREPTRHFGPQVVAMQHRGLAPNRYIELKDALDNSALRFELAQLLAELAEVQRGIGLEMAQDGKRDNDIEQAVAQVKRKRGEFSIPIVDARLYDEYQSPQQQEKIARLLKKFKKRLEEPALDRSHDGPRRTR